MPSRATHLAEALGEAGRPRWLGRWSWRSTVAQSIEICQGLIYHNHCDLTIIAASQRSLRWRHGPPRRPHRFPTAPEGADERTRPGHRGLGPGRPALPLAAGPTRGRSPRSSASTPATSSRCSTCSPTSGVTQRALAEHWSCDPSWVTNRIDRLEQLGLVERRLSPTDRRVKEVWLTAGRPEPTRAEGMAGFGRPPELLARAVGSPTCGPWPGSWPSSTCPIRPWSACRGPPGR